jgi:DNA primase
MSKFENITYDKKAEERKDKLKRMNKIAMKYFVDQLKQSEKAINYVKNKRKLTAETVKKFQL